MIKIIDGKRYNTDTAKLIFSHENGRNQSDFDYISRDLYLTKNKAWFIHHFGGAHTYMGVPVGSNGIGSSQSIEPIESDDAFYFLQAQSDESEARNAIDAYFPGQVAEA